MSFGESCALGKNQQQPVVDAKRLVNLLVNLFPAPDVVRSKPATDPLILQVSMEPLCKCLSVTTLSPKRWRARIRSSFMGPLIFLAFASGDAFALDIEDKYGCQLCVDGEKLHYPLFDTGTKWAFRWPWRYSLAKGHIYFAFRPSAK